MDSSSHTHPAAALPAWGAPTCEKGFLRLNKTQLPWPILPLPSRAAGHTDSCFFRDRGRLSGPAGASLLQPKTFPVSSAGRLATWFSIWLARGSGMRGCFRSAFLGRGLETSVKLPLDNRQSLNLCSQMYATQNLNTYPQTAVFGRERFSSELSAELKGCGHSIARDHLSHLT